MTQPEHNRRCLMMENQIIIFVDKRFNQVSYTRSARFRWNMFLFSCHELPAICRPDTKSISLKIKPRRQNELPTHRFASVCVQLTLTCVFTEPWLCSTNIDHLHLCKWEINFEYLFMQSFSLILALTYLCFSQFRFVSGNLLHLWGTNTIYSSPLAKTQTHEVTVCWNKKKWLCSALFVLTIKKLAGLPVLQHLIELVPEFLVAGVTEDVTLLAIGVKMLKKRKPQNPMVFFFHSQNGRRMCM